MTATSAEVDQLYSALVDAQPEFTAVAKTKTADTGKFAYSYADLASIMREVLPVLSKHGLAITQHPGHSTLTTRLVHRSGQWQESEMDLCTAGPGPQAQGSAITYARRYALGAVLGIVTEEDDDGKAAQPAPKARPRAAAKETGEMVSDAQLRMLGALFGNLEFTDRSTRLAYTSNAIGREVASSKELTKAEATKLIDLLQEMREHQ